MVRYWHRTDSTNDDNNTIVLVNKIADDKNESCMVVYKNVLQNTVVTLK